MDVPLSSDALDLSFHPSSSTNLLAAGLISGKIQLIDYDPLVTHTLERAQLKKSQRGGSRPAKKKARRGGPAVSEGSASSDDDNDKDDGDKVQSRALDRGIAPSSSRGAAKAATTSQVADDGDLAALGPAPKLYQKQWTTRPSTKSCRGLHFTTEGSGILTLSKDKSIFLVDTETGKTRSAWSNAHDAAPSRVLPIDAHTFVTGDDDGVVRMWDDRRPTNASSSSGSSGGTAASAVGPAVSSTAAVRTYTHHFDWITDLLWCPYLEPPKRDKPDPATLAAQQAKKAKRQRKKHRRKQLEADGSNSDDGDSEAKQASADDPGRNERSRLVCTSGDGTLSVIDVRMSGARAAETSEDQEDELLSVCAVKGGAKLVVGTQLGMLSLWAPSRGLLDHVDRIPGHPASVDAIVPLDYDTVLTGSSDGLVRVVQILPHKLLGVVADHAGLPVERVKRKDRWVASLGHGNEVKVTDVGMLLDGEDDDDSDQDDDEEEDEDAAERLALQGTSTGAGMETDSEEDEEISADDDEDVSEEESDDDDDDDDESDSSTDQPKPKPQWHVVPSSGHERTQKDRADFFADL